MTSPAVGDVLPMSIQHAPARIASTTPPVPSITSCTSGDPGSIVISTSALAAACAEVLAQTAPTASATACVSGRWSAAVTGYPARTRLVHIGIPIRPRPTRVTRGGEPAPETMLGTLGGLLARGAGPYNAVA